MIQNKTMKSLTQYLKSHNIGHIVGIDNGSAQVTMVFHAADAPGHCIEACIWFYKDTMEARVYYSDYGAEICRKSEHIDLLLRVLNFINARVFLPCSDGALYEPHLLYTPRIYMTADDCFDITITTIIPYDFCEVAPIETYDYLTAFCPELLDRLVPPIFGTLLGKQTADEAISYIKKDLLTE